METIRGNKKEYLYTGKKVIYINFTPIYESILNHNKKDFSSFHTPGHKSNFPVDYNFNTFDLTELPDTDSLYEANDSILRSEINASKIFNSKKTIFSASGCTLCIQTMLKLVCSPGDKIIADRNSHRSLVNTLGLIDIEPIWVYPEHSEKSIFPGVINPDDILKILQKEKDIKAVYITTPNYFGILSDIEAIKKVCNCFNIPLLIDNAHGSHLYFINNKFYSDLSSADLVACSLHKTLPVLTSGAILNINNPKYVEKAKYYMSIFGSTSPSYPVLASIDLCMDWLNNNAVTELKNLCYIVSNIIKEANINGIKTPQGMCDPVRIALDTSSIGITGYDALNLMHSFKIEAEYANNNSIIFIPSPFNTTKDFQRLKNAINKLPRLKTKNLKYLPIPKTYKKLSIRESMFSDSENINILESKDRISSNTISTCPPGIPLVMPGEVITQEMIDFLISKNILHVDVVK